MGRTSAEGRRAGEAGVTPVIEEYLAAIYGLAAAGEPVIGARLARRLGVAPASVTEMLRRLTREGFVTQTPSRAIELTEAGQTLAETIVRRHRLAERWLTDELGLHWAEAQDEAQRLRHALSPLVERKLSAALGEPATCPHGNPIPGAPGQTRVRGGVPLTRAARDELLVVQRLTERIEEDGEALATLEAAGLAPGVRLYLRAVDEAAEVVEVERAGERFALPLPVAAGVVVRDPVAVEPPGEQPIAEDPASFVVGVASVDGWCRAHHQRGDRFEIGHCSPNGLCVEALVALHPELERLRRRVDAGGNPVAEFPCPEDGTVTFRVEFRRPLRD